MLVAEVITEALPETTDPRVVRAALNICTRQGVPPDLEWGPKTPPREQIDVVTNVITKASRVVGKARRQR